MAIETLLALLPTALMIIITAGILWAIAAFIPHFFARYMPTNMPTNMPTAYRGGALLLQAIVFVGGVVSVGQVISREAAAMVAAILAMLWCGSVGRDIYRFVINHTAVAPSSTLRINRGLSTPQPAMGQDSATTAASAPHLLAQERLDADEIALNQTTVQRTDSAVHSIPLANWLDLSPLPSQRLTKRAGLGKQTITSFRFTKHPS